MREGSHRNGSPGPPLPKAALRPQALPPTRLTPEGHFREQPFPPCSQAPTGCISLLSPPLTSLLCGQGTLEEK